MPDLEPTLNLPPDLSSIELPGGAVVRGRKAIVAKMLELPGDERAEVVLVLSNGFRAPWGKFLTGDDEP